MNMTATEVRERYRLFLQSKAAPLFDVSEIVERWYAALQRYEMSILIEQMRMTDDGCPNA